MLYQSSRPETLDDFVGNKATVSALRAILRKGSVSRPHAILFHGPTGCGKTTLARILAKEFGCDSLGIIELNAANTRGIDTIRDLAKNAFVGVLGGEAKVYILDESHQLTSAGQEALLKVIEDVPEHCYFIFCTTEPQNIIKTVRNRCAEFQVGSLGRKQIVEVLMNACNKNKLDMKTGLLEAIAEVADGSPRRALVHLENVLDMDNEEDILDMLVRGTEVQSGIFDLCKYLRMGEEARRRKWQAIVETAYTIEEEPEGIRRALLSFLSKELVKCTKEEKAQDLANLMRIFSTSTYYGGKPQFMALIARACFGDRNNK